jgi:hypothetical protein
LKYLQHLFYFFFIEFIEFFLADILNHILFPYMVFGHAN